MDGMSVSEFITNTLAHWFGASDALHDFTSMWAGFSEMFNNLVAHWGGASDALNSFVALWAGFSEKVTSFFAFLQF